MGVLTSMHYFQTLNWADHLFRSSRCDHRLPHLSWRFSFELCSCWNCVARLRDRHLWHWFERRVRLSQLIANDTLGILDMGLYMDHHLLHNLSLMMSSDLLSCAYLSLVSSRHLWRMSRDSYLAKCHHHLMILTKLPFADPSFLFSSLALLLLLHQSCIASLY